MSLSLQKKDHSPIIYLKEDTIDINSERKRKSRSNQQVNDDIKLTKAIIVLP